jgi:hypothetical protein
MPWNCRNMRMLPYIVRQNFSKKITLLNNRVKRGEIANTALF